VRLASVKHWKLKTQLIRQFLGETLIITTIAALVSLVIGASYSCHFSDFIPKDTFFLIGKPGHDCIHGASYYCNDVIIGFFILLWYYQHFNPSVYERKH
jgi:fatty acid desaturase